MTPLATVAVQPSGRPAARAAPRIAGHRAQHGSVALTTVVASLAMLAVVLPLLVTVAAVLSSGRSAAVAADAAALAVLSGSPLAGGAGTADLAAGQDAAAANGARLSSADLDGWPTRVTVSVAVGVPGPIGAVLGDLTATASARLAPP